MNVQNTWTDISAKKYMQIENKHVNYIEEQSIIRYQNAYQNN